MALHYPIKNKIGFVLLVLISLLIGCVNLSQVPAVKIENARYESNGLVLRLNSNMPVKNVRLEFVSKGNVLCTKYVDLDGSISIKTIADCSLEEKLTITAIPPGGTLFTKDFDINIPSIKLQEGYKYDYGAGDSGSEGSVSVYITSETPEAWEGISVVKNNLRTSLIKFKIFKEPLSLMATLPLSREEVDNPPEYKNVKEIINSGSTPGVYPFILLAFKGIGLNVEELITKKISTLSDRGRTGTLKIERTFVKGNLLVHEISMFGEHLDNMKFYVSALKPYLLIDIGGGQGGESLTYKGSTKKSFSINDYAGYTFEK